MERDREAFEAHIRSLLPYAKFDRDEDGGYIAVMLNARWMGWQAALAYVRKGVEPLPRDEARFRRFYPEPRAAIPPDAEGELLPPNMVRRDGVEPKWSPDLLAEASQALARMEATRNQNPEEWAAALAKDLVAMGEAEYGAGYVTESSGCVFRDLNVSPPEKE